eukprot:m.80286 g.80286  ORF g.80286 m.80286 type:complete len:122 (+) comp8620_c0_seq15:888-1253(+)
MYFVVDDGVHIVLCACVCVLASFVADGVCRNTWKEWDVNELVGGCCKSLNLLVSQGGKDEYLVPEDQLFVEEFVERAKENNAIDLQYEYHEEFGHGYFFLSTFIEQHISFHKYHLTKSDED